MGKHAGNLYIKSICRSIQTLLSIKDAVYYNHNRASDFTGMVQNGEYMRPTSENGFINLNSPIQLPSEFKISFTLYNTRSSSAWGLLNIGESSSSVIRIGKIARTSIGAYLSNSTPTMSDTISSNVDYLLTLMYQNGEYTLVFNGKTMTLQEDVIQPLYLIGVGLASYSGQGSNIKDLIVEGL